MSPVSPGGVRSRTDRVLEVQLADCRLTVSCDARLETLADRLRTLFAASVHGLAPTRAVQVAVRGAAVGPLTVTGPGTSVEVADQAAALEQVMSAVNAAVLPPSSLLTIHAGAVQAARGVVAWPAASGAGKSTLVAAALQRGYPLVSDESLCLDPATASAVPYPKPLSLDARAVSLLGLSPAGGSASEGSHGPETVLGADQLGAGSAVEPLPVAAVVLIRRGPQAALRPLGADRAVGALLRHSFNHWRMPAEAVSTVHALLATATVHELTYDHPRDGAQLLVEELPPPSSATAAK